MGSDSLDDDPFSPVSDCRHGHRLPRRIFLVVWFVLKPVSFHLARSATATEFTKAFTVLYILTQKYEITPSARTRRSIVEKIAELENSILKSRETLSLSKVENAIRSLKRSLDLLEQKYALEYIGNGPDLKIATLERVQFMRRRILTVMRAEMQKILEVALLIDEDANASVSRLFNQITYIIVGLTCALALVIGIPLLLLSRDIARALDMLVSGVKTLQGGDLAFRIQYTRNDEHGELVTAFNEMAENLDQSQTALAQSRDEAVKANEAKSHFLASMSHDLRTPLNAIMGFSDIMIMRIFGPVGDPRYEEYVSDIHKSGMFLISLINDILDLSKIESGNYELKETWADIASIINSSVEQTQPVATGKDQSLIINNQASSILFNCDVRAMTQVLNNLTSNAVKFSPSGARIEIGSALSTSEDLQISVTDFGVGISEEGMEDVCNPFGNIDSEHRENGEGTGLGLFIVNRLVGLHGGALTIDSTLGAGTKVTLCFPAERLKPRA